MSKKISTKQKICEQAKRLFEEKGYYQVSLREIAEASGTTIGNLTYHFRQKEDLLAAIQVELHAEFQNEFFPYDNNEKMLLALIHSFEKSQSNKEQNQFYFKYVNDFARDSKSISENNEVFRKKLYKYYFGMFLKLQESDIFRSDISQEQMQTLAYIIVFSNTLWTQDGSPFYDEQLPEMNFADAMKNLLFPYLTEKGTQIYELILNQKGKEKSENPENPES